MWDDRSAPTVPATHMLRIAILIAAGLQPLPAQSGERYLGEPIRYEEPTGRDPAAALQRGLADGSIALARDPRHGVLPALLDALDVPASSQTLVFSKTSFQNARISPDTPRAIYFGDDAYVGYVPGSDVLEVTAVDPLRGPIFYTVTDRGDGPPRIERNDGDCLRCHALHWTRGWPGLLVRSVFVDQRGQLIQRLGATVTNHESPFDERWGGWYVTGTHGDMTHRGNVVLAADAELPEVPAGGANVTDLADRIDASRYLSPHSDLVALMVLEHQTWMHDLLAWADYEATLAVERQRATNRELGDPPDHRSDATRRLLQDLADEILRYLLFRDEAPLAAPIQGTSGFADEFAARGPRDQQGRSLRELDLRTRLFRWPCSYVIQSTAFAELHPEVREIVLLRLHRILTGRFGRTAYRHLSADDRRTILEILRDTVPALTHAWSAR
ncbi:MAG: hypothetical protein IPM29_12905 [Planctomycetes bacterium]|nr:hypothetical protein [Planctomycetota bacterium]